MVGLLPHSVRPLPSAASPIRRIASVFTPYSTILALRLPPDLHIRPWFLLLRRSLSPLQLILRRVLLWSQSPPPSTPRPTPRCHRPFLSCRFWLRRPMEARHYLRRLVSLTLKDRLPKLLLLGLPPHPFPAVLLQALLRRHLLHCLARSQLLSRCPCLYLCRLPLQAGTRPSRLPCLLLLIRNSR